MTNGKRIVRLDFSPRSRTVIPQYSGHILTPAEWMAREIRPQDALLGELFTTTSRILMAADTGAGKTMFGFAVAFAMHLGRDFLHWKAHRPANVVYIDGEMPSDLIQDRIAEACRWFDISPPDNGPYFLSREDYEDMEPLDTVEGKQWLEDKLHMFAGAGDKPDFVVFDNIKSLCSGVMKDEELCT